MTIVYLVAGAAGMYCGSCLHDNTLCKALKEDGHECLLVPTYTPIRTDEPDVSERRLFYSGINVYLQDKLALFRGAPRWVDRMLAWPPLVKLLAGKGGDFNPAALSSLLLSMLEGERGRQKKELDKLVDWLAGEVRPRIVHLSNAMLLGMARRIRRDTGALVVCSLSGEDVFLDRLPPGPAARARGLMQERAADVAAFVALNRYYADRMIDYLAVDPARVHVIRHGLSMAGHGTRKRTLLPGAATIGYFARVTHDKGFHILVDAFRLLCRRPNMPTLTLKAAGYLSAGDRTYLKTQQKKLAEDGLLDRFEYLGEPDRAGKIAILQTFDLMAVPTVYRESKGLSILEAWANAVPVVVPDHGTFPELIRETGGGWLHRPESAEDLAEVIHRALHEPHRAEEMGKRAQAVVRERFTDAEMARETSRLYTSLLAGPTPPSEANEAAPASAGQEGAANSAGGAWSL
jgi:glycosyltransferase involved in cell wall biosynthesis